MPLYPPSKLDSQQVLKHAYDDTTQRLRTDAVVTVGTVDVFIDQSTDSIKLGDGTNLFTSTTVGPKVSLDVSVASGNIILNGLKTSIRSSAITVTDVAQKIPATGLTNRNGMSIRVWGANTVYFGSNLVTATNGYPKTQFEEISLDIQTNPTIDIWAICAPGQTSEIRILEVA